MAKAEMKTLIKLGQGGQCVAFGLAVLGVSITNVNPLVGLAIGLSASYLVAIALLTGKTISIQYNKSKAK